MTEFADTEDFNTALRAFGSSPACLSDDERATLDDNGFLVLQPDLAWWRDNGLDLETLRTTIDRLVVKEGWRGGIEGKEEFLTPEKPLDPGSDRLGNLIDKHSLFRHFIGHPKVLAAVHHIVAAPFKCSAVDMRSPRHRGGEQHLHIDWTPRISDEEPYDCVVVGFYIDGMTRANGALRIMPGTHRRLDWPNEHIDVLKRSPEEVRVEVVPGGIVIFNGLTWHAGARNESGAIRRTVYIDYRNRRLPQLLNQKRYLRAETIASLSTAERYLLAVRDEDPTDETAAVGPGAQYRARYGNRYIPATELS